MHTLILYESMFGNTAQVAQAMEQTVSQHGTVRLLTAEQAEQGLELEGVDLLIVGCPTQHHQPTGALQALLDRLPRGALSGIHVAAFDTRYHILEWVSGSAARLLTRKLRALGGLLVVPAESFFVTARAGPLEDGERERAARWARLLISRCEVLIV